MDYSAATDLGIFLTIALGGFWLEAVIANTYFKKKSFTAGRYLFFLLGPTVAIVWAYIHLGDAIIYIALFSAVVGSFLEYVVGSTYTEVIGSKLWRYKQFNIREHTSVLALPLWSITGVFFLLASRMFL